MKNINLTKQDIISRIGYFRNKKGFSAYELSLRLGYSYNYFYRVETGEIQLTIDLLLQVLEILEVTTFEFFYPNLTDFEIDKQNLELLKSLNTEEKKSLLTILKINK